jgi:NAD(P)H-dependent FMN reductase
VVFVAPEYNHGLSAIQKNAIDWLFNEWTDKPVAFVAYGWYAGAHTLAQLQEISTVIKWKPVEKSAGLQFTKDIELDGSSIDGGLATQIVGETLDLLV